MIPKSRINRLNFDTISITFNLILYYFVNVYCECKTDTGTFTRFFKIKNAQCRITSSIVNIPFKYTYCVIYCTYTFCIFLCSLVVRPLFIEFFGVRSEFNFWFSLASFVLRPFFGRTYHCVFLTSSTCFRPVQKQFSTASRPLKKISHRFN